MLQHVVNTFPPAIKVKNVLKIDNNFIYMSVIALENLSQEKNNNIVQLFVLLFFIIVVQHKKFLLDFVNHEGASFKINIILFMMLVQSHLFSKEIIQDLMKLKCTTSWNKLKRYNNKQDE